MFVVNRSVAVIRPQQPYVDWIHSLPGPHYETLDDLQQQSRAVLLPESDTPKRVLNTVGQLADRLFQMELEAWTPEEHHWPTPRDFATFMEWFRLEVHLLVIDSAADQLTREPYS